MPLKNNINILMISSSSKIGGGTKHMFLLGESLNKCFNIFYAIPKNEKFSNYLNSNNCIFIAERKLTLIDIIKLNKFIKRNSIDIIHAHGKGAGVIARILFLLKRKPLIYTFHGIHLKCHSKIQRLVYIVYELIFGIIDSNKILVSESEKNYAIKSKIYLGNKSKIINNGVVNMPNKFKQNIEYIQNENFDSTKINIISLCRLVYQKNIKEILKIAITLTNLNFLIIGKGPLIDEINFDINNLKIKNVFLLGEKIDVFKYLYLSDIYLSTSLYEGLPISILEAMSIGLPIVASNVMGNCDAIEDGKSGFLYELNNIEMASSYLRKLANSKNLRESIGNNAFKRQRNYFSKNVMVNNYKKLYESHANLKKSFKLI